MLVICVEAGLGLTSAIARVAEELKFSQPDLASELAIVNAEMRAGVDREVALDNLNARTGLSEIRGLVSLLQQTLRFGTGIADSLRVCIGWADDGPRAGYFPFYIGLMLAGASGWIILSQLSRWNRDREVFAEHEQLRLVMAVFVPMVVYVALIFGIGIYVASALLIGYFMRRYGKYRWVTTLPVALGVPLFFFVVFERWFLVLLPKGPLERLLGL